MRLLMFLLIMLTGPAQAGAKNEIASFCKKVWPGDKGVQLFCIRENTNYYNWLQYTRKRVFAKKGILEELDECISDNAPDYRKAHICYWDL